MSFLKYLEELPYVHLIPYESMSKYDLMDTYETYFVDGTGLGYEIAYRNKFVGRKVNIFYLSGLPSDEEKGGFDGIVEMGAVPRHDQYDFILLGVSRSNYEDSVIQESFPHTTGKVPDECFKILTDLSEEVNKLWEESKI